MRHASVALIALIVLCSLGGCGTRTPELAPPPVILNLPDCPAPDAPRLPPINGALPFDAPANIAALLERDDVMRAYIKGLDAAITCFRRSSPGRNQQHD
jgi:hypothetical protein